MMREQHRVGAQYLEVVTALLQRSRSLHPVKGLFEAADLQWWWRTPRSTDEIPQLFFFDHRDRPEAAVIATAWGDEVALAPILLPDAAPDWVAHVIDRGLVHASERGFESLDLEVDLADDAMRKVLLDRGFAMEQDGADGRTASVSVVETWLAADARPSVSKLREGYRLLTRLDAMPGPHHMIDRGGPEVEQRLRQTSLYRPDLDLFVLDRHDRLAAFGLFWFDPETATGLVEPMRTEDDHQRKGLARHILSRGMGLLAAAGAERIKICFEPDNAAARTLYLGVGFEPIKETAVFSRRAIPSIS